MEELIASKPRIPYDDFAKLELKVAKIIDAQPVAGSDKLYKLTLRIGSGERSIISGIAEHYAPDELLGKKIIVIANLEPKKIRGEESNGMLLAAVAPKEEGKPERLALVTVDDVDFPDGSDIC